jgi:hypothetical protein
MLVSLITTEVSFALSDLQHHKLGALILAVINKNAAKLLPVLHQRSL